MKLYVCWRSFYSQTNLEEFLLFQPLYVSLILEHCSAKSSKIDRGRAVRSATKNKVLRVATT